MANCTGRVYNDALHVHPFITQECRFFDSFNVIHDKCIFDNLIMYFFLERHSGLYNIFIWDKQSYPYYRGVFTFIEELRFTLHLHSAGNGETQRTQAGHADNSLNHGSPGMRENKHRSHPFCVEV